MSLKVCTVYDSKSEYYMPPMYFKHRGDAIRSFTEASLDSNNMIGKYPADFTMFEIGSFDETTGKFSLYSSFISLGCALEFLSSSKNSDDKFVDVQKLAQTTRV